MRTVLFLIIIFFMISVNAQETYDLEYATYLGGNGGDRPYKVETDEAGNLYIFGTTSSSDFPTSDDAADRALSGSDDAFLVKLNAEGELIYSRYIGGGQGDGGRDMVVKHSGEIYLLGMTSSNNFPISNSAYRTSILSSQTDAFLMKLSPDIKTVSYSTYFFGEHMGVDEAGHVYTVKGTGTSTLPTTEGVFDESINGNNDLYIAKLSADGSTLLYGTYLGGSQSEDFPDIAVDDAGNAYVISSSSSADFPTTAGAFDTTFSGNNWNYPDQTITKLNPDGSGLVYSTYLGGEQEEREAGIRVDDSGCAYISGVHLMAGGGYSDFPTTPNAYDAETHRHYSAYFTKLDPSGSELLYSTFFGGKMTDRFDVMDYCDFDLDNDGNLYFAGNVWISERTYPGFPITTGAYNQTYDYPDGNNFLTGLNSDGTDLVYSTIINGDNYRSQITIDIDHNIYVVTSTKDEELLTTENAFDRSYNGDDWYSGDLYIMKFKRTSSTVVKHFVQKSSDLFKLCQNYPNPFNPSTMIRYQLTINNEVTLEIYNMVGQKVATLVNGSQSAGEHSVQYHAEGMPAGIYLARLQAGLQIKTMKLILQK